MSTNVTEQAVIDVLRAHYGGLGAPLDEKKKQEIINGRPHEMENLSPVDGGKFYDCAVAALDRHSVQWILR